MKSADTLMMGLVDYAGLFPPASQEMRPAIESYAAYRAGEDSASLGRFILPAARLDEFEVAARDLLPRGSDPWLLSVLVGNDPRAAGERMLRFNCHHWSGSADGHAIIDAVELKAGSVEEIERQHAELPRFFTRYFEIPVGGAVQALAAAIARVGGRAKVRTGGVTPDAFPTSRQLLDFIRACHETGIAFKATAGLHHPLRGNYPLTYEAAAPAGVMFGFLNLFVASALVQQGASDAIVLEALEERDPAAFDFSDDAVVWKGHRLGTGELGRMRENFATSFGSCSFREPVDELRRLISAHA